MNRRFFLQAAGALVAQTSFGYAMLSTLNLSRASADTGLPLKDLRDALKEGDALVLVPSDAKFGEYQISFNKRVALVPQARVLARTPEAIATVVQWARANDVPFAVRGGGHSYEGFSQSRGVVIDVRLMNSVEVSGSNVTVGAGAALGEVYAELAKTNKAIPAGSCPTVGVAGHTLGGGFGLLARPLGLACDSLTNVELIDADSRILKVNANENADLFWGLRGGGNGNFGVASEFQFKTHDLKNVAVFGVSWLLPVDKAVKVMRAYQDVIPPGSDEITAIFKVSKSPGGLVSLRIAGQSVGSEGRVLQQLQKIMKVQAPVGAPRIQTLPFISAVKHFAGNSSYPSVYMKAKSDYVKNEMTELGMRTLMNTMLKFSPGAMVAICDSYGGAVNRVETDATAFAHREGTMFSIQYYSEWSKAAATDVRISQMRELHTAMRPHVSGEAYVNYCDLDIKDYGPAYWAGNFDRLKDLKMKYDPKNVFKHAQSIPVR